MLHDMSQIFLNKVFMAFAADLGGPPQISLRSGDLLDDYKEALSFDPAVDALSDEYMERYHWGLNHLDAASWRHYLPSLMEYAFRHIQLNSIVVDALLNSLRPPDREPPRLAALTYEQETIVVEFLDAFAFAEDSAYQELACQVLEEWWVPSALYRQRK